MLKRGLIYYILKTTHFQFDNYHLYKLSFESDLMPWKPNKAKKHDVMSVFCGLSGMNV